MFFSLHHAALKVKLFRVINQAGLLQLIGESGKEGRVGLEELDLFKVPCRRVSESMYNLCVYDGSNYVKLAGIAQVDEFPENMEILVFGGLSGCNRAEFRGFHTWKERTGLFSWKSRVLVRLVNKAGRDVPLTRPGDSGSPVCIKRPDGLLYLLGVVIAGTKSAKPPFHSFMVNVNGFTDVLGMGVNLVVQPTRVMLESNISKLQQ